jgi:hypothetical protein
MAATYRPCWQSVGLLKYAKISGDGFAGMEAACSGNLPPDALAGCLIKYYQARIQALQHMVAPEYRETFFQIGSDERHLSGPDRVGPPRTGASVEGTVILVPDAGGNDKGLLNSDWKPWHQALQGAAGEWALQGVSDWRKDSDTLGDMHLAIEIGPVSDWLVTASIRRYWKLYGPHGDLRGDHALEFNWLLKEHRELKPEDIFSAGSGWDKELLTRWDDSLRKQLNNYV